MNGRYPQGELGHLLEKKGKLDRVRPVAIRMAKPLS